MDLMKLVQRLDLEKLAADFMEKLKIKPFDMYFVVKKDPGQDGYELLGMAYSESSAAEMRDSQEEAFGTAAGEIEILQLDIAKLLQIVEQLGAAKRV